MLRIKTKSIVNTTLKSSALFSIILLLILGFSDKSFAQKSPFNAGLVLGLNASQIDGDNAAGFTKLGIKAGLQGVVKVKKKINIVVEFLYSQRGAQDKSDYYGPDGIYTRFRMNYFEIPLYIEFLDWEVDDYYKMHFIGGFSVGILRDAKIQGSFHTPELLNDRDFSLLTGIDYYANKHMGGGIRYTYSLSLIHKNGTNGTNLSPLKGHFLSFHTFYRIK